VEHWTRAERGRHDAVATGRTGWSAADTLSIALSAGVLLGQ